MWMTGNSKKFINSSTCFLTTTSYAETIGPGVMSPFTVSNGNTYTIVGDTTVSSAASHGVSVTHGTVELGGANISIIANSGTGYGFNIDSTTNASFL